MFPAPEDAASIFVLGSFVAACSAKVARLPQPGESLRADAFTLEAGGKGFNLLVGTRRLGARVDGLLAIGDDHLAQLAEPALARGDLPLTILQRCGGATGSGIGFTDAQGENALAVFPGANLKLSSVHVQAAALTLQRAKLVLAQFEIGDDPIVAAFTSARAAGALTLLNPSPYRSIDAKILAQTSILVLNRTEATHMAADLGERLALETGRDAITVFAERLLDRGPEAVIITLGADGALAARRSAAPLYQPGFHVVAVDALGAGDAFTAGFAVSFVEGLPFQECLRRGAACGALVVQRLGVFEALPTRQQLEGFLLG